MTDFDLRPRVVFHPPGGAVAVLVDPTTATSGNVVLPGYGAVPYDVFVDFPISHMILHLPMYGDFDVPLNLLATGGGASYISLPLIGDVPYEIVLGPPDIAPGGYLSDTIASAGMAVGPWAIAGVVALGAWFLSRRR
jgi:hypothetical protein